MRPRTRGLSMVEVLAAMVIFSSSAVLLFGWMADASSRLARLRAEQRLLFAQLSVIEYAKTLNPMQAPQGDIQLADGVKVSWRSRQVGPATLPGPRGNLYEAALFEVELKAEAGWGEVPSQQLLLAGWKQVREGGQINPFGGGGG